MRKFITQSQSSKNQAYHNERPSEIPRSYLENICYGEKPVSNCAYRQSTDCPRTCEYLDKLKIPTQTEKYYRKYPQLLANGGLARLMNK